MAIERLSPRVPAKANVTHKTPEVTDCRVRTSSSRAKLKIKMTSSEKTSMAEKSSRERSSAAKSFQMTADMARRNAGKGDKWSRAAGEMVRGLSAIVKSPRPVHR